MTTSPPPTVFLHFPKTAGTSLATALGEVMPAAPVIASWREVGPSPIKPPVGLLQGHLLFDQIRHLSSSCRLITIFRHPIERTISFFHHVRRDPTHPQHQIAMTQTLEEFAASGAGSQQYLSQLTGVADWSVTPAVLARAGTVKERLAVALERLEAFDLIGSTEDMASTAADVEDLLGIESLAIGQHNSGRHGDARHDLSPAAMDSLQHWAWADIEIYHRAMELRDQSRAHRSGGDCP